jgi:leucyl aminopeptidase
MRMAGSKICAALNSHKQKQVIVEDVLNDSDAAMAIVEGIALSNYQFLKYRSDAAKEKNTLRNYCSKQQKAGQKRTRSVEHIDRGYLQSAYIG